MKYLEEIDDLNLPKDEYVIAGSGLLAIKGLRENNDIDIFVTSKLWGELSKNHNIEKNKNKVRRISIGNIEIFNVEEQRRLIEEGSPVQFITMSETIEGYPFLSKEMFFTYKKNLGRPKDKRDIKLLKNS